MFKGPCRAKDETGRTSLGICLRNESNRKRDKRYFRQSPQARVRSLIIQVNVQLMVTRSEAYKQRAQWLAALLERRAAIENNIVACIERLAEANIQATKELGLTVGGRVDMAAEWKANGPASRQG